MLLSPHCEREHCTGNKRLTVRVSFFIDIRFLLILTTDLLANINVSYRMIYESLGMDSRHAATDLNLCQLNYLLFNYIKTSLYHLLFLS